MRNEKGQFVKGVYQGAGFKKGQSPWNVGKHHSLETIEKIRSAKVGIKNPKHSKWMSENNPKYWDGKKRLELSDEKNPMWKGSNVGYRALHRWVEAKLGKPTTCEHCGATDLYHHSINWANKSGSYLRDITDWLRLCVKCHRLYDKARIAP